MGIVKIRSGEPARKSSHNCGDDDLAREEITLLDKFPSHEFDDNEHAVVGCELAISGGQIFNIPYSLYDLPDLKEVLSLETWNLCLTDDDRFHLAAYLPDMDQHTFFVTMKELLSGSSMFFGSPLGIFFHKLGGGFYSPKVCQAREGLLFFQRRGYYRYLKSYHDGMIQKFVDMKRLWSYEPNTNLKEKVHIWNNWRCNKPLMLVDLNSFPSDENLSVKGGSEATTFPHLKRAKHVNEMVATHCSAFSTSILAKDKEVLRAKSVEMDPLKNHLLQRSSESWAKDKKLPKGVLKIMTKGTSPSPTQKKEKAHPTAVLIPVDSLGMHSSRFFAPYYAHSFAMNSSHPCRINAYESTSGNSHSSAWQKEDTMETGALLANRSSSVQNMVVGEIKTGNSHDILRGFYQPAANHSLVSSEASNIREFPNEKNLLKNFGQQNCLIHESSLVPYTYATKGHQKKACMTKCHPKDRESISEMLTLGTSIHLSHVDLLEQSETKHKYHDDLKLKTPPGTMTVTQVEGGHNFPVTYKRKKAHKKLNLVGSVTKSSKVVDLVSPSVPVSITNVKAKALKIKFKGWSSYVGSLAAANNES